MEIWYFLALFLLIDALILIYVLFGKRRFLSDRDRVEYVEHWNSIRQSPDHRHAVMEADKLLDILLGKKGYKGPLGEKMKKGGKLFSDINGVWSAHKLRNRIAHELNHKLSAGDAAAAMRQFERAFKDLGLL